MLPDRIFGELFAILFKGTKPETELELHVFRNKIRDLYQQLAGESTEWVVQCDTLVFPLLAKLYGSSKFRLQTLLATGKRVSFQEALDIISTHLDSAVVASYNRRVRLGRQSSAHRGH